MHSNDRIRLKHILDEANSVLKFVEGFSFDSFLKDSKTVHAVIRSIEIIGEAAAKISKECKKRYQKISWADIIGMRNHLIHVYFDIEYESVWETI